MKRNSNSLSLSLSLSRDPSVIQRVKETFGLWLKIIPHMPRVSRYTIGTRIENHFLDLLELIYKAYYTPLESKSEKIVACITKVDLLKYLIQIGWENKFIKETPYTQLSEKLQEVGRILGGWKKGIDKKLSQ